MASESLKFGEIPDFNFSFISSVVDVDREKVILSTGILKNPVKVDEGGEEKKILG